MTSIMNKCFSVRCTQRLSSSSPKVGAMYCCYVQDPTRFILGPFNAYGLCTLLCERLSLDLQ
jgi:hypothetical protein